MFCVQCSMFDVHSYFFGLSVSEKNPIEKIRKIVVVVLNCYRFYTHTILYKYTYSIHTCYVLVCWKLVGQLFLVSWWCHSQNLFPFSCIFEISCLFLPLLRRRRCCCCYCCFHRHRRRRHLFSGWSLSTIQSHVYTFMRAKTYPHTTLTILFYIRARSYTDKRWHL